MKAMIEVEELYSKTGVYWKDMEDDGTDEKCKMFVFPENKNGKFVMPYMKTDHGYLIYGKAHVVFGKSAREFSIKRNDILANEEDINIVDLAENLEYKEVFSKEELKGVC